MLLLRLEDEIGVAEVFKVEEMGEIAKAKLAFVKHFGSQQIAKSGLFDTDGASPTAVHDFILNGRREQL